VQPLLQWTSKNVAYSKFLSVALDIQHANECAILSSVACPSLLYFFTFSHKGTHFEGGGRKGAEYKMCVLIFCTAFRRKHFSF
jgi:hypothetical protein